MSNKNFVNKIKGAFNVLSGNAFAVQQRKGITGLQILNGSSSFMTPSGYNLARDGYNANAIAYYCVRLVASACALVPLRVYRKKIVKGELVYERDLVHPLNKFVKQPNKDISGQRFQYSLHTYQLVAGNCYLQSRFRNAANEPIGEPFEWDLVRADRMEIKETDGIVTGYVEQLGNGGRREHGINRVTRKSSILHLKDFNPVDDFYGMSPLQPASKQIDISNQAARFNKALLDNTGRLSLALRLSEDMPVEEVDNVRNEIIKYHAGTMNAGSPFVYNNVEEIKELGINPKDMEFSEAQLNAFRLIANAVGVPTYMLGLRDTQSTFNNMMEAKLFFYQTTVSERMGYLYGDMDGDIEGEINLYLQKFYGDDICIKPHWDKVDALAMVREKRYQRAKEMGGIWTIDEQRELTGKDPLNIPGFSDIPWRGTGEAPMTFAGLPTEDNQDEEDTGKDAAKDIDTCDMEFKLINDDTPESRKRELAIFDRFLKLYERKLAPRMARIIDRQAKECAAEYQNKGSAAAIDYIVEKHNEEIENIYSKHYKNVMNFFGNRVIDAFGKRGSLFIERKAVDEFFNSAVARFIATFGASEVKLQSETTKSLIKEAILRGEKDGKTSREIAKDIVTAAGGAVARKRSLVIASTETHAAANYAQKHAAISATGEDSSEWVSAEDSRTRPSHYRAGGQRVKDGGKFLLKSGGEIHYADYPGDPTLPAKERVRCRCTTTFVIDEE